MRYSLAVFLVALFLSASGHPRDLTLEQALQMAEVHSFSHQKAQTSTTAAVKSLQAAKAERLPTLSASASAHHTNNVPVLEMELPVGPPITREFGSKDTYQTDLRLTLPVFTGGKISSAIEMARANSLSQQALEQMDLNLLYYQTRLDYLGLHRAIQLEQSARSSLRRTEIIVSDVNSRHAAGVADSVDLLEAQLAFTRAGFTVRQAGVEIRTHEIRLLSRLGLPQSERLELADTVPDPGLLPTASDQPFSRPELDAALAGVQMKKAQLGLESAELYPSLSVYAGYSYGKPNVDPFNDEWNDNITAGARLAWSFNTGNKTVIRKTSATLELEAARHLRDHVVEQITKEARLAYEQMRLSYERYLSAREEYELTSQSYHLARVRHRQGVLSANRLLEIEASLTQAESGLAAARVDSYIAESGYYYATGSAKIRRGI